MQFDPEEDGWKPAHDPQLRLRSPWPLAIALAILALGAAGLMSVESRERTRPPAMAGVVP